jgi:carboxylesterase type B
LSLPTTGAEVPFVFGLPAEVTTDAERSLSAAMGCYWTSFATTGSPNSGDCVSQLHLPQWPMLDDSGDVLQFQGTDVGAPVKIVKGLKNKACSTFAKHYNK